MYRAEICSPSDLLVLATELEGTRTQSAFCSPHWLGSLLEILAPHAGADPFGVVVRETGGGGIAGILPLAARGERGFKTVRFADFGVTDYAAPILGPCFPSNEIHFDAFRAAAFRALSRFDLVRFERMLPARSGSANPLVATPAAVSSRMSAHVAFVPETVKAYVAALGRKVRKEVERCERIISAEGEITLHRARTEAEAALAFARLESLQSARWDGSEEGRYRLDQPAYGRFYRAVLERGSASGFAEVFTLFSGDIPVGAIFGIRNDERFIVLRIASDDARWGRASPGRSTLLAVMEHFVGEGIRTIDLGIGDYAFKRRIGAQPEPLFDLTVPLSWIGTPLAAGLHAKRFLGRQPAFKRFANRVRGRA